MAGTISSLGIGSGILTNDLLTKLRTGEETARLTPVDTSLTTIKTKQAALSTLMIDLANVKDKAADLSDSMYYLKRTATSTSTDVGITADSGVRAQSIGVKVTQLAQNDVYQSKGYKSEDTVPSLSDFKITINAGDTQKTITISGGSTLSAIADKINSESEGKYGASILNTGMGTESYKLILKSTNQGTDNALVINDNQGLFSPTATGVSSIAKPTYTGGTVYAESSKTLDEGAIKINGIDVASINLNGGSSEANATLIKDAINATANIGVTAEVIDGKLKLTSTSYEPFTMVIDPNQAESLTGLSDDSSSYPQLVQNDLKINGIDIGGFSYSSTDSGTYAEQLINKINSKTTDTHVKAELDGTKIKLTSTTNDDIKVTTTANGAAVTGLTNGAATDLVIANSTRLQKAQNSLFEYNGVNMSRSSNSVDDIVVGMKLTFNKVMDTTATLDIKQDTSSIVSTFKDFVTNYNTLSAKITELTKYDTDNKKAATFTGQNEITSILSKLNTFLTQQNSDGVSLTDMGLSRNEDGTISFNDATLTTKLQENSESAEKVLRGATTYKSAIYTSKNTPDATIAKLQASDLMINGVYIKWHDFTSTTAQTRAKELAEYLNTYKGETGVTASVDAATNKLILTDPMGGEINITASANGSKLLGLGTTKVTNQRMAIGSSTQVNGFFADISNVMKTLMVGSNSSLKLFEAGLQKELTSTTKSRASIADQINTRFELMANQFAAYDTVINKYNLMGQQVTAAINALSN
jgi:flagellar hook-associated protein 2